MQRKRTAMSAIAATTAAPAIAAFAPVESVDFAAPTLFPPLGEPESEADDVPESVVELPESGAPYIALIRSAARSAIPYAAVIVCAAEKGMSHTLSQYLTPHAPDTLSGTTDTSTTRTFFVPYTTSPVSTTPPSASGIIEHVPVGWNSVAALCAIK